jgi:hypothetical protein
MPTFSKKVVFVTIAASLAASGAALCANQCSGHGVCRSNDLCTCYANWQGADCSDRTCPFAKSWGDAPFNHQSAHYYSECSSQGLCDRKTGECQCFDGYEGDACRRIKCPNDCSGHGRCRTTWEQAQETSVGNYFAADGAMLDKGVINGKYQYNEWDAHKTRSCVCDAGWEGFDCNSQMCPKGNDPLTTEDANGLAEVYDVQTVVVGRTDATNAGITSGFFTLTFTDSYGMEWTTRPIPASEADDEMPATVASGVVTTGERTTQHHIRAALMALPNFAVDDVEVSHNEHSTDAQMNEYRITFTGARVQGKRNLLKCGWKATVSGTRVGTDDCDVDGCQPRFVGIQGTGTKCTVRGETFYNENSQHKTGRADNWDNVVGRTGTGEDVACSNRGLCDGSTGLCTCFEGYTGDSCSVQTILV